MSFDGVSSVQSRIAAIQEKIASLSNQGRPPVAVTESNAAGDAASAGGVNGTANSNFATELAKQVASANVAKSSLTAGRHEVQGIPGTAEAFVEKVKSYIGVPYVWGGTDPSKGLDCSGLVQTAAKEVGVNLPRVTYDQQHAGVEVDGIENAKPGDLIITRNSGHVVVYIGDGKVIHAPRPGKTVTEASVKDLGPIVTIRRVMRSAGDAPVVNSVNTAGLAANANPALAALMGGVGAGVGGASNDLGASLVSALSGRGAASGAGAMAGLMNPSLGGAAGSGASAALLSQFMGSSTLYGSNASNGLNSLLGGSGAAGGSGLGAASANASLSNTASSLSALSALRSSLGV